MFFLEPYIIIPIIVFIIAIIIVALAIKGRKNSKSSSKLEKAKATNRNALIKEANKRLAQNPKDPTALLFLADLHYNEKNYEKSFKLYEILLELCATESSLNEFEITLHHAVSAVKTKQYKSAYKSFMLARSTNSDIFEINYNLGYLEYMRKNFEKAAGYLIQAKNQKADDFSTYKYLGLSLHKINKFNDSADYIKKALSIDPDNKDLIFVLGECFYNVGQSDAALKTFAPLRNDPRYGAQACLYSGTISMKFRNYEQAAMQFELGLKNTELKQEMKLELKYRLATCYIKAEKISNAIAPLKEIVARNRDYKDAANLLKKYGELDENKNLKIFIMGEKSLFLNMCKRIITQQFPKTRIKFLEISTPQNDFIDMIVDVVSAKWEDTIIFRFVRTNNQVGELIVRDLYGRIKEAKAGKGVCITAGAFSSGAKTFVEARLIDLLEKDDLVKILSSINT